MGFGFNLLFIFILIPLTGILLLLWAFSKKNIFGKILGALWIAIIAMVIFSGISQDLNAKVLLTKKDFYGQYCIDKQQLPGKQSNWQYNTFRFEIKDNDSIYFYVTDKEKITKAFSGTITTLKPYSSERLVTRMKRPTHPILTSNPTIYRNTKSFYLVFNSPNYGNVFFIKKKWNHINK